MFQRRRRLVDIQDLIAKIRCFVSEQSNAVFYLALILTASIFLPYVITAGVLILSCIYILLHKKQRRTILKVPYGRVLIGFFGISALLSAYYGNHLGIACCFGIFTIYVCAFYLRSVMTYSLFYLMMDTACAGSVLAALFAIYQKLSQYSTMPTYRPESFFLNPNYYGAIIEFIVIIAIYRADINLPGRPFYAAVIGINLIGLYLCASMSAWTAMTAGVLVFLLLKKKYKIAAIYLTILILFILACNFIPSLFPRFNSIDDTTSNRMDVWWGAFHGFLDTPMLGRGPMAYTIVSKELGTYSTYHCHNLFLDMMLNYGIIGCGVFLTFMIAQVKQLWKRLKRKAYKGITLLTVSLTIAVLIHGITDVTIFWIQTGLLFMLAYTGTGIRNWPEDSTT